MGSVEAEAESRLRFLSDVMAIVGGGELVGGGGGGGGLWIPLPWPLTALLMMI
jgi:hypothetical protein